MERELACMYISLEKMKFFIPYKVRYSQLLFGLVINFHTFLLYIFDICSSASRRYNHIIAFDILNAKALFQLRLRSGLFTRLVNASLNTPFALH